MADDDTLNPGYPDYALCCHKYQFRQDQVNTQCLDWSRALVRKYVERVKNGIVVEIGLFGGATLLDLYPIAKANGTKVIGIDPFDQIKIFNGKPESNTKQLMIEETRKLYTFNRENLLNIIQKYGLGDTITVYPETSAEAVANFANNSINVLHIDGDHSADGVYSDLSKFYPKMVKGDSTALKGKQKRGVIIGDDYNWQSVQIGLNRFCQEKGLKFKTVLENRKFIIRIS